MCRMAIFKMGSQKREAGQGLLSLGLRQLRQVHKSSTYPAATASGGLV